jgi:hypothetical protein
MKAHNFFAIWLSKKAHLEYDADHDGFERRHGVTHVELLKTQWKERGVVPGEWMTEGMSFRRAEWFSRVLSSLTNKEASR